MFYCNPCARESGWPIMLFGGSYGPCELCGVVAGCNDVPSSRLPPAKPTPPKDEQDAIASILETMREVREKETP